jgi:hypothetical protein
MVALFVLAPVPEVHAPAKAEAGIREVDSAVLVGQGCESRWLGRRRDIGQANEEVTPGLPRWDHAPVLEFAALTGVECLVKSH